MPYELNDQISRFLPPDVIHALPLDFDWAEATNAILFTSNFDADSFDSWCDGLQCHYAKIVGDTQKIDADPQPDLGCLNFWFKLNPTVDVAMAYCNHSEGFEELNAWIGSSFFESMVNDDSPATAGIVRIRPF